MSESAVFLIHGLGGTQYDLGSMHKRLKNAGLVTHSITLPGHGTKPEDLVKVRAEDWLEAVRVKYHEVINQHEVVHVMGMCVGSLLAIETVKREGHRKGQLVALAPPVYLDGWSTPWYREARKVLYFVPGIASSMKVAEEDPYGIKNEKLRAIVKAKFERGENFHYGWVPLACIREVDRLRAMVMKNLSKVDCQTLVIHAREDELTSLRSATFLVEQIGGKTRAGHARMVVLEDSYHMICVDNDREIVAKNVLDFFGVSVSSSLGVNASDSGMSQAEIQALVDGALAAFAVSGINALRERGIPDFTWFQPGNNRSSGVYRGTKGQARWERFSTKGAPDEIRFEALGRPSFNAGIAVVPATLCAASLRSTGVLALVFRASKLLEGRWFPDDVALEDSHFGGKPAPDGPSPEEKAFEAATAASRQLKSADNDTLLRLYALYKQGSLGDISGSRPGVMDQIGRAKYDAWAEYKGLTQVQAMSDYVRLVEELQQREAS